MKPPCEIVQKEYLFQVRAKLARELNDRGFSQTKISDILHITQPAVSKYLSESITTRYHESIDILVNELAEIIQSENVDDVFLVKKVCEVCMLSRIGGEICERHKDAVPTLRESNCQICTELLSGANNQFVNRAGLLNLMMSAIRILEESRHFAKIIPQVRTNLVVCEEDAKSTSDVLAIPGRITTVEGYARVLVSPRFGASRHTAELLLWAKTKWEHLRSCICIAGNQQTVRMAEKHGFDIIKLENPDTDVEDIIKSVTERDVGNIVGEFIGIHVPGGIGVEPILYLFGKSVTRLVERTLLISENL